MNIQNLQNPYIIFTIPKRHLIHILSTWIFSNLKFYLKSKIIICYMIQAKICISQYKMNKYHMVSRFFLLPFSLSDIKLIY